MLVPRVGFPFPMYIALVLTISSVIALSSPPFILLSLGLHTLCVVCILGSSSGADTILTYFLPAVVGSLLWFMGILAMHFGVCLVTIGLLLKIGTFPFHYWGLKLVRALRPSALFLILVPSKLPVITLFLSANYSFCLLRLVLLFFGSLGFLVSNSLGFLLFWSSHTTLGCLLLISESLFFFYLLTYSFCILILLFPNFIKTSPAFSCLALAGLPPLYLFWVKLWFLLSLPLVLTFLVLGAFAVSAVGWVSFAGSSFFARGLPSTSFGQPFLVLLFVVFYVTSFIIS